MEDLTTAHRTVFVDAQAEFQTIGVERVTAQGQTRTVGIQVHATDRTAVVGQSPVAGLQCGQCADTAACGVLSQCFQ